MQKTLIFLAATLLVSMVSAQSPKVLVDNKVDGIMVDATPQIIKRFTIAKDSGKYINFSAALELPDSQKILITYLLTDSTKRIMVKTNNPDGSTSAEPQNLNNLSSVNFRSLSMFKTPRTNVKLKDKSAVRLTSNLVMFIGGNPLMASMSDSGGEIWSELAPVNSFGAYRVSNLTPLRDGQMMAMFSDDGRFIFDREDNLVLRKSAIYKTYSSDGGVTWGMPEIALKHNIYGLNDAVVMRSTRKRNSELVMITSDRSSYSTFVSFSHDEGQSWSYPVLLPKVIHGDRFSAVWYQGKMYIAFRDMCSNLSDGTPNPTFGDPVLWSGSIKELLNGSKKGIKMRIADNYPEAAEDKDPNDRKVYDCGYPSIIPMSGNRISIIISGRWEKEEPPYIENFIIDTKALGKIKVR